MPTTEMLSRRKFELMAAEYLKRMGERLRDQRQALGLTQEDVARQLPGRVSGNQVSRWERGEHRPHAETLERLAEVLQVDVAYFLAAAPKEQLSYITDGENEDRLTRIETMLRWLMLQAGARPEDLEGLLTEPASSGAVPELPEALLPEGARASNGEKAPHRPRSQAQERRRKSS